MMRKLFTFAGLALLVLAVGAAAVGSIVWGRLHEPFKGYGSAEQFIEIPAGARANEIGRRLVEAGVVRDLFVFRAAMRLTARSRTLKAGEYRFAGAMSAAGVVDKLARGDVHARRITFPEGLTVLDMAKIYEARGFGPADAFVTAAGDASSVQDLDPHAPDLEGYLYPETYAIPRGTPAARLIALMVERFRAAYSEEFRGRADAQGLTTREVVTVASLIEKETAQEHERRLVAAVYRNRMRIGMVMQADPTVIYALQKAGRYDGNIRRVDLDFDSPYNTYKYAGLPPGPIAAPRKASLEAALTPADVPYIYFVSRNDGSHVFASTLAEHNRNVRQFQVLFFREKRLREQKERAASRLGK
ncbi:MAG: endolytic transglycosylase MltG [Vicinamibacterales bacterium]